MTQRTYGLTQILGHGYAFTQNVAVSAPAAGAGFTYTNQSQAWQFIDCLSFQIVTSSQAANRAVTLTVKSGLGVALATIPTAAATTASKTGLYTFLSNYSAVTGATDGPFLSPFPGIFLQPDFTVVVAVGAIDTGDQVSNIRLQIEQFVTGSEGYLLGPVEEDGYVGSYVDLVSLAS